MSWSIAALAIPQYVGEASGRSIRTRSLAARR
jgi:hypothetical protein